MGGGKRKTINPYGDKNLPVNDEYEMENSKLNKIIKNRTDPGQPEIFKNFEKSDILQVAYNINLVQEECYNICSSFLII